MLNQFETKFNNPLKTSHKLDLGGIFLTAKYKINGFYYDVERIDDTLIYLVINNHPFPVRLSDVEDIS